MVLKGDAATGESTGVARPDLTRRLGNILDKRLAGRSVLDYLAHLLALSPLIWLFWQWWNGAWWINPIQEFTQRSGRAALWMLFASLAVTPLITLFGWRRLGPLRRTLGLYAFAYACLHLTIFAAVDYGLDPALLQEAILEKPYALIGFTAFLLLSSLALTSTRGWMRRLGKRWKKLHRLVYAAGILVVLHYAWALKADFDPKPLAFGLVLALLLGLRVPAMRTRISRWRRA